MIGARAAFGVLVGACAACTILTHADDYGVAPAVADMRLCAACSAVPALRHPPCPATSVSPSGDPSVRFYVMKSIDLGSHASEWGATFFRAGFDMDCSVRPDGTPTSCTPSGPEAVSWVSLPDGTDNAFGVQILASLYTGPANIDVQSNVNSSIAGGGETWGLAIDHWNGTPNDADVGVRLFPVAGTTAGGAPTWSSSETWIAYADAWDPAFSTGVLPDSPFKSDGAYVTEGTLVWDMRAFPSQALRLRAGAAVLAPAVEPVGLFGQLSDSSIGDASFGALLRSDGTLYSGVLDLASACDPSIACAIEAPLSAIVASVEDMVSLTTPGASACNRISFGADPYLVRVGGISAIVPTTTEPGSCEIQTQLMCADAGAD